MTYNSSLSFVVRMAMSSTIANKGKGPTVKWTTEDLTVVTIKEVVTGVTGIAEEEEVTSEEATSGEEVISEEVILVVDSVKEDAKTSEVDSLAVEGEEDETSEGAADVDAGAMVEEEGSKLITATVLIS